MKYFWFIVIFVLSSISALTQGIPTYYNNVNLNLTGIPLKTELSNKISSTHTTTLTYSQVWDVLKQADINPVNSQNVLLIYGWNDSNADITDDLNRDKELNGGNTGDWNREHTFAKSLATPDLGTSGPGADAHNLRASDVQRNGSRGNKKFASGTGQASGTIGANWYPGDDWRGDVARILMYMYLRYQNQCKPSAVTVGNPVGIDLNMVDLLLNWNAEDPPGPFEDNRNNKIFENQGNRNPFIDNPYLATLIWGGTPAQNRWSLFVDDFELNDFNIYPIPTYSNSIFIYHNSSVNIKSVEIYSLNGQKIEVTMNTVPSTITLSNIPTGMYLLKIYALNGVLNRRIVVK
ncbi:MAG: endonuclease [Putridiphycobacter sp.]|nr:endonuclease [Putridiphycobacter sp.]